MSINDSNWRTSKSEALEAWAVRKFEWSASWVEAMLYTAEKQPAAFFATCARLLPNDVRVTVEQSLPGNLSIEDWATLRQVLFDTPRTMFDLSPQ
jgi:hypothetical protein